jgi:hypothetical protein
MQGAWVPLTANHGQFHRDPHVANPETIATLEAQKRCFIAKTKPWLRHRAPCSVGHDGAGGCMQAARGGMRVRAGAPPCAACRMPRAGVWGAGRGAPGRPPTCSCAAGGGACPAEARRAGWPRATAQVQPRHALCPGLPAHAAPQWPKPQPQPRPQRPRCRRRGGARGRARGGCRPRGGSGSACGAGRCWRRPPRRRRSCWSWTFASGGAQRPGPARPGPRRSPRRLLPRLPSRRTASA